MNTANFKLLKLATIISIIVAFTLWIIFFLNFFSSEYFPVIEQFELRYPGIVAFTLFGIFSVIIVLKSSPNKGILLYAFFLSLMSQNAALQYLYFLNNAWIGNSLLVISSALTGTIFIKSLQSFPRELTEVDINIVFPKNKILNRYIKWSLKKYTWVLFPVIIGIAGMLADESYLSGALVNIGILLTAMFALIINYKRSTRSEQNKILWLFWGLLTYTFLSIITAIIYSFSPENIDSLKLFFGWLKTIVLVFSTVMSLFFSDTFDTGIIVKRTIVDGSIFIIIVLIYNTLEHYFLHWLSHELHVSDVLISSVLSGVFVLVFSPIHHKLMHFMEKRIKKHHSNA